MSNSYQYLKDMTKEEIEASNMSIEQYVAKLMQYKSKIIEDFTKAYLADSGLKPSEVELVQKEVKSSGKIETVFYFRKKVDATK